MMKSGAPPDKFRVLYRMVTYRIPWFHKAELILRVITLWFLVLSQFFLDGMGPFKVQAQKCNFGSTNDQKDNIIDQSGNKRYLL